MSLKIYVAGKLYDKEDAKISVYDHGLLYGDGVFEGMRSYDGVVFRLAEHLDRLWKSARAIMLEIPISMDEMEKAVKVVEDGEYSVLFLLNATTVEQLRNTGVRPTTAEGVTATDEDNGVEAQDSRRDQDTAVAQRQTTRGGFNGLGTTVDILV